MQTANVTIKGISPLLMHKFPIEPIEALDKKPKEEQAESAAYRTKDGALYVPGVNLQRSLVAAATYSKGKGRATLQKPTAACVLITPEELKLDADKFEIDSRPVIVPATRGRVVRHRPRIDEWSLSFEVYWDETLLTEEQIKRIVEDAGLRVGLLDFRPERKGPFGRFAIETWENGTAVS